ncbi:DUF222 domain-containing protein [Microbacterium sp.]|uniref:HNH endonuclease n=1 Tax=Microbacterium sp. TaxID=51671 RepID=UPI0028119507|nr:DUF222 domain-containing protein [Microbacterium sp.]
MTALMDVSAEQVTTLDELVDLVQSIERTIGSLQAARDGALALAARWALSVAEQGDGVEASDLTVRAVAAELGAALRVSDRTVQRRMADAETKVNGFPAVWRAQGAGRITAGHARVIIDAGEHLDDPDAREAYTARVLEFAGDESPNRLRPIAARLAEQYTARSLQQRHEDAREQRAVWVKDAPDGMAELGLLGPAALVHGVFDRLTSMAKTLDADADAAADADADSAAASHERDTPADPRTLSQKRADLALDLLLTGSPAGHDTPDGLLAAISGQVSVTVPVLTLMGADETGTPQAELDGCSPIDPATARQLAGAATGWDRVLTHPITGGMLAVDRYRPGESLRRQLRARDQRCRFVCCGMPARDSDLDHTHDAALGGRTEEGNLGALCRRHHVLKHHTPWHVKQIGGGLLEWTSPAGRVYIDRPPPQNTVAFTDEGPPTAVSTRGELWAAAPLEHLSPF